MPQITKNVVGKNVVAFCKLFCASLPLHIVLFCLCIAGFDCAGKTVVAFFCCEGVALCDVAVCVKFCCRVTNFCYRLRKNVQFYG